MTAPSWDDDGQPVNLEAAALDALVWLRLLRGMRLQVWNSWQSIGAVSVNAQRCDAAIAALERLLGEVDDYTKNRLAAASAPGSAG